MTDVRKYVVAPDTSIGPDVDLEAEELYDSHGNRITEEYVAEAVENVQRRKRGRPSLTEAGERSPRVAFRVGKPLQTRLTEIANREGKTISQVAREALERYLIAGDRVAAPARKAAASGKRAAAAKQPAAKRTGAKRTGAKKLTSAGVTATKEAAAGKKATTTKATTKDVPANS